MGPSSERCEIHLQQVFPHLRLQGMGGASLLYQPVKIKPGASPTSLSYTAGVGGTWALTICQALFQILDEYSTYNPHNNPTRAGHGGSRL